jgi:hypothetical protein
VGICEQCYEGYAINNGSCVLAGAAADTGCLLWDGNHKCLNCSARWVFNAKGVCVAVSDLCRTWGTTGACLSCYAGYSLSQGQCARDNEPFVPAVNNPLCKEFASGVCQVCSERAYFNAGLLCVPVSDYCNTWDSLTGHCLTCYAGFVLLNGNCDIAPGVSPSDLGCMIWDWANQVCLSCSKNWVFNANKVCVPVSDQCQSFGN